MTERRWGVAAPFIDVTPLACMPSSFKSSRLSDATNSAILITVVGIINEQALFHCSEPLATFRVCARWVTLGAHLTSQITVSNLVEHNEHRINIIKPVPKQLFYPPDYFSFIRTYLHFLKPRVLFGFCSVWTALFGDSVMFAASDKITLKGSDCRPKPDGCSFWKSNRLPRCSPVWPIVKQTSASYINAI